MSERRVYLVTGASGAIGSALVPLLVADADARVHVLLRAASDDALSDRMDALRAFWGEDVARHSVRDRLAAVRGDVSQPRLGMSERDYEALSREVTHVIHSAGNVKLNQSIDAARASAVVAAEEIVRFAHACAVGRSLPKVEYLSTVGVAGRRPGVVPEEPLDGSYGYHNTYEHAKAEAETVVLRATERGLPATVHRPSMVVGDSRDGRIIHFQVFYYLAPFLAGSRTRGVLPDFGQVKLDLVPADYVARAIAASAQRPDSVGRIFHLCSGPLRAAPLGEVGEAVRRFLADRGERVFRPKYVPRALLRTLIRVASLAASERTRKALESLPYFLDYLDEAQVFANDATSRFFASQRLESPPVPQFLPAVLEYWYPRRR